MSERIDLKEIERRAWTSYFQDGLWDIFMGILMLTVGIRTFTDNVWYTLLILAAVLVPLVGKKFITVPRIGWVRFGPARIARTAKMTGVIIVSVLATLAFLLLPYSGLAFPRTWTSPMMAVLIAVAFGLLAYYLDFGRLFAYGLLFAMSEVLWGMFGRPIGPMAHTVSGIVALIVGLVVLVRFLQRYPIPKGGEPNEGQ